MNQLILVLLVGSFIAGSLQSPTTHKKLEKIAQYVNSLGTTWKAGKNFDDKYELKDLKKFAGVLPGKKTNWPKAAPVTRELPESFDARDQWKNCYTIGEVRDQGDCGSCWAFGVVEAISDRICVASKGKESVEISANDMVACCQDCGDGCEGGFPDSAWAYYIETGVVTGGLYNSESGCQPYSLEGCDHHVKGKLKPCPKEIADTPECEESCREGYNVTFKNDKHFGSSQYGFSNDNDAVMADLMENGPMTATFTVYEDFLTYKTGVYKHVTGEVAGGHAVKLLGWGTEEGQDYWLVANSWNEDWGDNGMFKIARGEDECDFESDFSAGLPKLNK